MDYEYAQRRRMFIAIAITVILGPAAFLLTRGDDGEDSWPPVTVIGTVAPSDESVATAPTATDVMGTSPVDAMEGDDAGRSNDPATIAIPRPPQGVTGTATFRRDISAVTDCFVSVAGVPYEARVTVTNLNNSHQIACINNVGGVHTYDNEVVLHADAFLRIADLTDAPVPVQISW